MSWVPLTISVSGLATLAGIEEGNGNAADVIHLTLMLLSLALGAAMSGAIMMIASQFPGHNSETFRALVTNLVH